MFLSPTESKYSINSYIIKNKIPSSNNYSSAYVIFSGEIDKYYN